MYCTFRRVDAVADRRAANRKLHQVLETLLDNLVAVFQLGEVSRQFVAQGERGGVHQVGASDFLDVGIFSDFLAVGGHHALQGGQRARDDAGCRGDAHARGEDVVGGLRLVDVVIGREE